MGVAKRRELGLLMVNFQMPTQPAPLPSKAQVLHLPVKKIPNSALEQLDRSSSAEVPGDDLEQAYERFQVQMRLDVEQERELLYKSLLVVELLVFLFVLREALLRWLA